MASRSRLRLSPHRAIFARAPPSAFRPATLAAGRLACASRRLVSTAAAAPATAAPDDGWRTRQGLSRYADRRDIEFVLHEVERVEAEAEEVRGVLDSVEDFVEEWGPVDPALDQSPPKLITAEDGSTAVEVHPETKRLLADYHARGFAEMEELGLPFSVQCAAQFLFGGAFPSNPLGFTVLTRCAADLLEARAARGASGDGRCRPLTPRRPIPLRRTAPNRSRAGRLPGPRCLPEPSRKLPGEVSVGEYLSDMRAGKVVGTMALSEPHAGSSLGNIRTTAVRAGDGPLGQEYRLKGEEGWGGARRGALSTHSSARV